MSQQLAKLGYRVLVFGNPPQNSSHGLSKANPRFVSSDFSNKLYFDIAIAWRQPRKGKELRKRAAKVYLWPHDTYQEYVTDEQINSFDDVLWLSKWQRRNWMSNNLNFAKFKKIFGNGIIQINLSL